ncbi:MAG: hypothetical protein IJH39_11540 [Clostridia bacterium]|nr:hypothetical protein [Clostridia bacterium]
MKDKSIIKQWWFWLIVILVILVSPSIIKGFTEGITEERKVEYTVNNDYIVNSKAKEYFEKLCELNNIEKTEPIEMGDSWNYESSNETTNIQVNSNKETDEIYYIKIMALSEVNEQDFLNACELEYKYNDVEQAKKWVKTNLRSNAWNTISFMHFRLTEEKNNTMLEIYTLHGKDHEKEQEKESVK